MVATKLFSKIKSIKHIEIYIAIALMLIAVIVYIAINSSSKEEKVEVVSQTTVSSQIESILSKIDGVGECHVVITYKKASIVSNTDNKSSQLVEDNHTLLESATITTPVVVTLNGTSQVLYAANEDVYGVVIVCDGGDKIEVISDITRAIKTLLDVNGLNIQVYKLN